MELHESMKVNRIFVLPSILCTYLGTTNVFLSILERIYLGIYIFTSLTEQTDEHRILQE